MYHVYFTYLLTFVILETGELRLPNNITIMLNFSNDLSLYKYVNCSPSAFFNVPKLHCMQYCKNFIYIHIQIHIHIVVLTGEIMGLS